MPLINLRSSREDSSELGNSPNLVPGSPYNNNNHPTRIPPGEDCIAVRRYNFNLEATKRRRTLAHFLAGYVMESLV